MEEPGCLGGRLISNRPFLGPEERLIKSFDIFDFALVKDRLYAVGSAAFDNHGVTNTDFTALIPKS